MTIDTVKKLFTRENLLLIKRFFGFMYPYRTALYWATFLMTVTVLLVLPIPLAVRHLIDVTFQGEDYRFLHILCFSLVAVIIFSQILNYIQNLIYLRLRIRILFDVKLKLFKHIMKMHLKNFETLGTGYLMSRIVDDIRSSSALFAETFVNFVRNLGVLLAAGGFLLHIHPKLALVSFIFFPRHTFNISFTRPLLRSPAA